MKGRAVLRVTQGEPLIGSAFLQERILADAAAAGRNRSREADLTGLAAK